MFSQTLQRRPASTLIGFGDEWAYLDDGSDQGELWRLPGFDDANWRRGSGPLGTGYSEQATVLACGPTANCDDEKHATVYFRKQFDVDDPSLLKNVMAQVVRDDGVIVYVNGTEVFRDSNIRSSTMFDTFARLGA
jgi:hypothetical protein